MPVVYTTISAPSVPTYTEIERPSGLSYDNTNLWDGSHLPWLITSFPWLKTSVTMSVPSYTEIPKPV